MRNILNEKPSAKLYSGAVALHAILAGLFMYYLLRVFGGHRLAALIAGIGYMLCAGHLSLKLLPVAEFMSL